MVEGGKDSHRALLRLVPKTDVVMFWQAHAHNRQPRVEGSNLPCCFTYTQTLLTCMVLLGMLPVGCSTGKGFVTGATLERGELGGAVVLSSKDIWVMSPVVVPEPRELLQRANEHQLCSQGRRNQKPRLADWLQLLQATGQLRSNRERVMQ